MISVKTRQQNPDTFHRKPPAM